VRRLRSLVRRGLAGIDRDYQRRHQLTPVGPLLFVGRERYAGPARTFADGTRIEPGDLLGTLHFDNSRVAELETGAPTATGLRFARLMFQSLKRLGELATSDEAFRDIAVFRGIGWLRHGGDLGFENEPMPPGLRQRFLTRYLRLLVWAFAADERTARSSRPEPTVTWLTRSVLLTRFNRGSRHG
jgi:hypothetical protein